MSLRARWRALPPVVRDGLLAAAVTTYGQVELLLLGDGVSGSRPLQHLAFAVMTGALVARRARPVTAALVAAGGLAVQTLLGEAAAVAGFAALLVVTYSVAQYADSRRDALLGLAAVVAAVELYPLVAEDVRIADEIGNMLIPVVVWVFARLARERLDRAVRAEREAVAAEQRARDHDAARAAAIGAERRRIAREMHDVVGHGVTLMLLHTDAAQAGLGGRETAASAALDVVLAAGRTALDDLHRMLRLLREDPDDDAEAPGMLVDLDRLAAAATGAGLTVTVTVDPAVRPVPAVVEATAYRVVQEGVTNVLRHSGARRMDVHLERRGGSLVVEVTDDGTGARSDRSAPGFGLAGLRERAAVFDGRVTAGPRDDGPGWRVRAVLPVAEPAAVRS